jgi:hypothetical protein
VQLRGTAFGLSLFDVPNTREGVNKMKSKSIAIHHRILEKESFEDAAKTLFDLVKHSSTKFPKKPRHLFLEIEGHRNTDGGFDKDMFELQKDFLLGYLGPYLTGINIPLGSFTNKKTQKEDIGEYAELQIREGG